jgi:hypothetical protein
MKSLTYVVQMKTLRKNRILVKNRPSVEEDFNRKIRCFGETKSLVLAKISLNALLEVILDQKV